MSKTDKTRPFKIRLGDDLARIAHHDHSNGFCDLPSTLAEELARAGSSRNEYNCFWDFVYTGINVCGCGYCRQDTSYRNALRSYRQLARRELRDAAKEYRAGHLDAGADFLHRDRDQVW